MTTLNLGAGNRIIEGAINHDIIKHRPEINVVWDLNNTPWPWKDNEFDRVDATAVLEHLKLTLIESCNEIWRILKPGGQLVLKIPIVSSPTIHDDPTHRWFWSERCIEYLDPTTAHGKNYEFYTMRHWQILNSGIIKERNLKAILTPRGK